jgi:hypothetical protein
MHKEKSVKVRQDMTWRDLSRHVDETAGRAVCNFLQSIGIRSFESLLEIYHHRRSDAQLTATENNRNKDGIR